MLTLRLTDRFRTERRILRLAIILQLLTGYRDGCRVLRRVQWVRLNSLNLGVRLLL